MCSPERGHFPEPGTDHCYCGALGINGHGQVAMTCKDELLVLLVHRHGERWRRLITTALEFIDKHEPSWGLYRPIDRCEFIACLVEQAEPRGEV